MTCGNFQRARHNNALERAAVRGENSERAVGKRLADVLVVGRLDDQDVGLEFACARADGGASAGHDQITSRVPTMWRP